MVTPIHKGLINNGKVKFFDIDKLNRHLLTLNGKNVEIVIRLPRKDRTNPQNKYLWGVVYDLISESTGYTPNEVHDAMRMMFLKTDTDLPTLRSTTDLSTVEFNKYIEDITIWSAGQGIVIPEPNEVEQ